MTILDLDTRSIDKSLDDVVGTVTESLGTVAETLGSTLVTVTDTLGTVSESVAETFADDVLPAARTGARRTVRVVRSHPRMGLMIGGAIVLLAMAMWFRRRRRNSDFEHLRSEAEPPKKSRSAA
jgi:hypothetical protein